MNGNITSRAITQHFAALLPMSSPEFLTCAAAFLYYLEPSRTHPGLSILTSGQTTSISSRPWQGPWNKTHSWELVREINVYIPSHIMLGTVAKGRSGNCRGAGQREMYFACKSLRTGDIEWGLKGCIGFCNKQRGGSGRRVGRPKGILGRNIREAMLKDTWDCLVNK